MNLNKVFIAGRLTVDPQLKTTPQGQSVSAFSVATSRFWKDQAGAKKEKTEFHNVVLWGKQAELASQYLNKGSLVLIEGRLSTRSWQDKQGIDRRTTEVVCERIQFGPRNSSSSDGVRQPVSKKTVDTGKDDQAVVEEIPSINIDDDIKPEDLPF